MTTAALRERYFANTFVDALRLSLRVDEAAWDDLLAILGQLATEWRSAEQIDKDIAQDLFVLGRIIRASAAPLEPERSLDLVNRAEQVDALTLDAFDGSHDIARR